MDFRRRMYVGRRRVAVLIAAVFALSFGAASLERTDATAARAPLAGAFIGQFTGETTPDGPVYRLPSLQVVADRGAELARIEREVQRERAREAQAQAAQQKPDV